MVSFYHSRSCDTITVNSKERKTKQEDEIQQMNDTKTKNQKFCKSANK